MGELTRAERGCVLRTSRSGLEARGGCGWVFDHSRAPFLGPMQPPSVARLFPRRLKEDRFPSSGRKGHSRLRGESARVPAPVIRQRTESVASGCAGGEMRRLASACPAFVATSRGVGLLPPARGKPACLNSEIETRRRATFRGSHDLRRRTPIGAMNRAGFPQIQRRPLMVFSAFRRSSPNLRGQSVPGKGTASPCLRCGLRDSAINNQPQMSFPTL